MEKPDSIAAERLVHAHALQLLSHARDYLLRLPVVPATRELAKQIDGFLADPATKVAQVQARQQQAIAQTWDGGSFTAAGEPLVLAEMNFEQPDPRAPTPGDRVLTLAGTAFKDVASEQVVTAHGTVYPALRVWLRPAEKVALRLVPKDTQG